MADVTPTPISHADNPLLAGPILPVVVRFALPNIGAMVAGSVAAVAETAYVGRLGVPALAGMAVVFPFVMLQAMLSAGAMGSGLSAAIARALGAGDHRRAEALAAHGFWIGLAAGLLTTVLMLAAAPLLFGLLGATGPALDEAVTFARVAFLGATGAWLLNLLAAVLRGSGNMAMPSTTLLVVAAVQVVVGGTLGLGLGPAPQLGMAGIGAGQVVASAAGALFLVWYLRSGRSPVGLRLGSVAPERGVFVEIIKTGLTAALAPIMSISTIVILNRLVAGFGPTVLAGFGIGTRLEFLLTPLGFAVGVASVPMVGAAIGAGIPARARAAAWVAARLAAAVMAVIGLVLAVMPGLWVGMFTDDPATIAAAAHYFRWAGPTYGFFGVGMSLFFSALAAGKVAPMLLAGALRLAIVLLGSLIITALSAPVGGVFMLIAAGTAAYGIASMLLMARSNWGPAAR